MNYCVQRTVAHCILQKMAIAIFLVLYSLLEISHSFINKWESEFFFPLILWKMVSALTNKSVADILSALTVEAGL